MKDLVNADKPPHARTHTGGDIEMREASGERERERKGAGDLNFKNTPKGMLTFRVCVCVRARKCVEKMKGFIKHTGSGLTVVLKYCTMRVCVCTTWKYF